MFLDTEAVKQDPLFLPAVYSSSETNEIEASLFSSSDEIQTDSEQTPLMNS